jgi:hypothetical protein
MKCGRVCHKTPLTEQTDEAEMKTFYRSLTLATCILLLSGGSVAQTDGQPSYKDTIRYIQARLTSNFYEEMGYRASDRTDHDPHCIFQDREAPAAEGANSPANEVYFDLKRMSPHIVWTDPSHGYLQCKGKENCVATPGRGGMSYVYEFTLVDRADQPHVQKALTHLLDLCGVPPESSMF